MKKVEPVIMVRQLARYISDLLKKSPKISLFNFSISRLGFIFCIISLVILICGGGLLYYFASFTPALSPETAQLFDSLERTRGSEDFFILSQHIYRMFKELPQNYKYRLLLIFARYAELHPADIYNAFYYYILAQHYRDQKADPVAALYYDKIIRNNPDLLFQGTSIHYLSLSSLLSLVQDPQLRIQYLKMVVSRFSGRVDLGAVYYRLGKLYEDLGEWDLALQAYSNVLKYPDIKVPENPEALREIQLKILFNNSRKDWLADSPAMLKEILTRAIKTKNYSLVDKYQSKIRFFTVSWGQELNEVSTQNDFNIVPFLTETIGVADTLDTVSNESEAYLRTWGWDYRVHTWYFYFRKINFPADPEVNGKWEWAGIYFGDKL